MSSPSCRRPACERVVRSACSCSRQSSGRELSHVNWLDVWSLRFMVESLSPAAPWLERSELRLVRAEAGKARVPLPVRHARCRRGWWPAQAAGEAAGPDAPTAAARPAELAVDC